MFNEESGEATAKLKPVKNSTEAKSEDVKANKPKKSRQITLPEGYNRLEIPKMSKVRGNKLLEMMGIDLGMEIEDDYEDDDDDDGALDVDVTVSMRSIRDVDEINEVNKVY